MAMPTPVRSLSLIVYDHPNSLQRECRVDLMIKAFAVLADNIPNPHRRWAKYAFKLSY
jgi:hypothetical protein